MVNICFIGCGKLGQPASEFFKDKGFNVKRVDINDSVEEGVANCKYVFVAVPTPHDPDYDGRYECTNLVPKNFDYSIVQEVVEEANKYMNKDQCIVLISTVLPGTVSKHIAPLASNTNLLYNPYLIAMGTVKQDMETPEVIMIGGDD